MRRPQSPLPVTAVAGLLGMAPVAAAASQFTITAPPLGQPAFERGDVQYRLGLGYRGYQTSATDLAGPFLSAQRRQALSDRLGFNLGGVVDYLSGTDEVLSPDDEVSRWQAMFHLTGELQQRFTPRWNGILFAGPKFGFGGYDVDQQVPPGERLDASTRLLGYIVGVQSPVRLNGVRVTPFVSYEEIEARHEVDSSRTGDSTTDYTYEVVQYGVELSFVGSGLTLGATFQDLNAGSETAHYTIFQAGYQL